MNFCPYCGCGIQVKYEDYYCHTFDTNGKQIVIPMLKQYQCVNPNCEFVGLDPEDELYVDEYVKRFSKES